MNTGSFFTRKILSTKKGPLFALRLVSGLGLVLGIASTGGCSNIVSQRCDAVCKCENCGTQKRQQCEEEANAALDIADAYNCGAQLDPFLTCEVQKYSCQDGHYSDDTKQCQHEFDNYNKCLNSQTARDQGPYTPPGVPQ